MIRVLDTALTLLSDRETWRQLLVSEAEGGSYMDPQLLGQQSLALATAILPPPPSPPRRPMPRESQ